MAELRDYIVGRVYTRRDWGAPAVPGGAKRKRDQVIGYTQHHTTGATLGNDNTVQWVKNIYDYHTEDKGWDDIGYAYLVDKYGNVFIGRDRFRTLAHARGYNTEWLGVAYLGTGSEGHVTDEAKRSLRGLYDWLRNEGGMVNMTRRTGHRDLGDTTCPDDYLYQWAVVKGMPLTEGEDTMPTKEEIAHAVWKYLDEHEERNMQFMVRNSYRLNRALRDRDPQAMADAIREEVGDELAGKVVDVMGKQLRQ